VKPFKIVFYLSHKGELTLLKTLYRQAEKLVDLVMDPPPEFFELLESHIPIHGWAEIDDDSACVFVIFAPRGSTPRETESFTSRLVDAEEMQFRDWLNQVKPSDFSPEE
jgi:hypothetical protein